MRVLIVSTPIANHFLPLVPLAWALRAAGHEVMVLGQPDVLRSVRAGGQTTVTVGELFNCDDMLLNGLGEEERPLQVRPRPAREVLGGYGRLWMFHAKAVFARYLEYAEAYRPELIIADPLEYCSLIMGTVLDVPVVHHRWSVDEISGVARRSIRPDLQELCDSLGVPALPDPDLLIDPCPPSLQVPGVEQGVPIRYLPFSGSGQQPDWLWERRAPGGPRRVAVSLGNTLELNGAPFTRRLLHALAAVPDTEIVATVGAEHRAQIGEVPAQVRMIDPLPLQLLLGSADVMVHHGGSGTAMSGSYFGLPQLTLPQLTDHFAMGDRLTAVGVGLTFQEAAQQDDPAVVGGALEELLTNPGYRAAARELAAEIHRMPSPARVAADLEQLALEQLPPDRPAPARAAGVGAPERGE
ncbi:nucleotide disphospho-sugar-binding domain-containing protein [Kitasatospora sp. NPDC058162]|uniref:nucleotide disphospho-sugar-binding domain-containing protein n=1 Tax=Kitasatospora sp. NPDC058162 TaxID=3346362 RepID=UPI0036DB1675